MTVESPAPTELDEQRAELKTVLESKGFSRAPTLANLLSYLCEKYFAGESGQIKEYSIGVEVFRRGESFDQDSDSIVRVEANRLRRRLAEYYLGEGAANRLQITIPIGQYVPKFEHRPGAAVEIAAASAPKGEGSGATQEKKSWLAGIGRGGWLVAAALLILLVAVGIAWHSIRQQRQAQMKAQAVQQAESQAELPLGPPSGDEVRILAGASRSFVDHADKWWNADRWFTGGTAVKIPAQHIARTLDPGFYHTSRQGQFRYDIPLHKGIYELRLHFAETVYGPESNGAGGEGSRILNVRANGKPLLTNFDVIADAGAGSTADVKVFPEIAPAADGMLHLEFTAENGQQATLSAIEILPGLRGRMRPVRVLARQTPYYSNDSHWWSPDDYFEGGQLATYAAPVGGTDDPELYESERWGNFSYAIPVAAGKYAVALYFAVRRGAWDQPATLEGQPKVAHIFNVFCNGKVLLANFDLAKEAGNSDVAIRRFQGLEPNAQGKLVLSFVPVQGYATVTGIEVVPQ